MDDFVTVLTVSYPQQLWIIKGRLEAEGIVCFVKDELTVQSNNLWSNAVGGVKLQVQRENYEKAIELLKELDYIKEDAIIQDDLLTRIDRKTSSLPVLKKFEVANRVIILFILIVSAITTIAYLIIKPSKTELLTKPIWIIDKIYFNNKIVGPKTVQEFTNLPGRGNVDISGMGEIAIFSDNNTLMFPGINSTGIHGTWDRSGSEITLHTDTLNNILGGVYGVDISDKTLTLKSRKTIITAHSN